MTPRTLRHLERGVTLTELTIATVLASVVMFGLVGFYMGSQGVWIDSSGQALTQREATQLVETITERAHGASSWTVTNVSGDSLQSVTFFTPLPGGGTSSVHFWWSAGDKRIHIEEDGGGDQGPLQVSEVQRFAFRQDPQVAFVEFDIRLKSPENHIVAVSSGIALLNRP